MKINRIAFLETMKKALPGVEKGKTLIEGADTFVFSNNAIHSYNDIISVSAPIKLDKDIQGAVGSVDFYRVISKMVTDDVMMTPEDNHFELKSGSTEAKMTRKDNLIADYISTLNIEELTWKELPSDFIGALKLCRIPNNYASQRGIFIHEKLMLSTDVVRINRYNLPVSMDTFWIDDDVAGELIKIDDFKEYCVGDGWVHFRTENGTVFSCKRKDHDSYPIQKIQKVLEDHKKEEGDIENVLPKGLNNVVDRISTLASEIEKLPAIKVTVNKKGMLFYSERTTGKIKEGLVFDKELKKDVDISVWIDPFFLIEISRKVSKFYIKTTKDEEGDIVTLVFYTDTYTQLAATTIKEDEE